MVTEVEQKDVPIYKEWVGVLDGSIDAVIQARVNGYIVSRNYHEGTVVKPGELLFQIDPRPFQAALAQAKADLAKAQATQLKTGLDVKRFSTLVKQGAVSQEDYDTAAQADASARADVEAQKAAVQNTELNLKYTDVTSPVTGVAGQATANLGDLVGPSTGPLTTISVVDPIRAYVSFSEQEYLDAAPWLKQLEGLPADQRPEQAEMTLANGDIYPLKGRFDFADRQVDARTGTIRIALLFPNPDCLLRPGQFARVRVLMGTRKGALLVPQRAVNELQGSYQVAVLAPDNKIEMRPVRPAERVGYLWVITEGLRPGERVVAEGLQKIHDGTVVIPKPWTPPEVADRRPATLRADGDSSGTKRRGSR